jgi:hypothetical protein
VRFDSAGWAKALVKRHVVLGGYGAVPARGGDDICKADVGTALRAFAHPTDFQSYF